MAREVEAYVLVYHEGGTERVIVEDGHVVAGSSGFFLGALFEDIKPRFADVLKISGATNGKLDKQRMKHARILAKIADEVAKT